MSSTGQQFETMEMKEFSSDPGQVAAAATMYEAIVDTRMTEMDGETDETALADVIINVDGAGISAEENADERSASFFVQPLADVVICVEGPADENDADSSVALLNVERAHASNDFVIEMEGSVDENERASLLTGMDSESDLASVDANEVEGLAGTFCADGFIEDVLPADEDEGDSSDPLLVPGSNSAAGGEENLDQVRALMVCAPVGQISATEESTIAPLNMPAEEEAAPSVDGSDDDIVCRICMTNSSDDHGKLFRPCNCKNDGVDIVLHEHCLSHWVKTTPQTDNLKCSVCHRRYNYTESKDRYDHASIFKSVMKRTDTKIFLFLIAVLLVVRLAFRLALLHYFVIFIAGFLIIPISYIALKEAPKNIILGGIIFHDKLPEEEEK